MMKSPRGSVEEKKAPALQKVCAVAFGVTIPEEYLISELSLQVENGVTRSANSSLSSISAAVRSVEEVQRPQQLLEVGVNASKTVQIPDAIWTELSSSVHADMGTGSANSSLSWVVRAVEERHHLGIENEIVVNDEESSPLSVVRAVEERQRPGIEKEIVVNDEESSPLSVVRAVEKPQRLGIEKEIVVNDEESSPLSVVRAVEERQRPGIEKEIVVNDEESSPLSVVRAFEKPQRPGNEKEIVVNESTTSMNTIKALQLAVDRASTSLDVWTVPLPFHVRHPSAYSPECYHDNILDFLKTKYTGQIMA
jgi:hypothetical protein